AQEEYNQPFDELEPEHAAALQARLKQELRTNTFDPETGDLIISPVRAQAIAEVGRHYTGLVGDDPALADLREAYAIPRNTLKHPERLEAINAFFFWAAWTCTTNRPGSDITYTQNWPAEPLVGNAPTGSIVV